MAYCIGDSCISCGSCEGQCPVGAISMGDGKFEIDPGKKSVEFPPDAFILFRERRRKERVPGSGNCK